MNNKEWNDFEKYFFKELDTIEQKHFRNYMLLSVVRQIPELVCLYSDKLIKEKRDLLRSFFNLLFICVYNTYSICIYPNKNIQPFTEGFDINLTKKYMNDVYRQGIVDHYVKAHAFIEVLNLVRGGIDKNEIINDISNSYIYETEKTRFILPHSKLNTVMLVA